MLSDLLHRIFTGPLHDDSAVQKLCIEVFGGNFEDMCLFFEHILSPPVSRSTYNESVKSIDPNNPNVNLKTRHELIKHNLTDPKKQRTLTIELHQRDFRESYLEHCATAARLMSTQHVHELTLKQRRKRFKCPSNTDEEKWLDHLQQESNLLFVDMTPPPQIQTAGTVQGILALSMTICDPRWHGKCESLLHIPDPLALILLTRFPNNPAPKQFVIERLLSETARDDPFVQYQLACPLDAVVNSTLAKATTKAVSGRVAKEINSTKSTEDDRNEFEDDKLDDNYRVDLHPDAFALTASFYFRYRIHDLNITDKSLRDALFATLMRIFDEFSAYQIKLSTLPMDEELPSSEYSVMHKMSQETILASERNITANAEAYARLLPIARELYMLIRFSQYPSVVRDSISGRKEDLKHLALLRQLYTSAEKIETRLGLTQHIVDIQQDTASFVQRNSHWVRAYQMSIQKLIGLLSHDLSRAKEAEAVRAFLRLRPHCLALCFLSESTCVQHLSESLRSLNKQYPTLRMRVVELKPASHESPKEELIVVNLADIPIADPTQPRPPDEDCIMFLDGGERVVVLFSSPSAHQRLCSYWIYGAATAEFKSKQFPYFPFVLRMYAGVFGEESVSELPEAKRWRAIHLMDAKNRYESLWLSVQVMVEQLVRVVPRTRPRLIDHVRRSLIPFGHPLTHLYRLMHGVCRKLHKYLDLKKAPYPFGRHHVELKDLSLDEAHVKFVTVCDIMLCFLCMNTTHAINGALLEELRQYLQTQYRAVSLKKPHVDYPHSALLHYLDALKQILEGNKTQPLRIDSQEHNEVPLIFDSVAFAHYKCDLQSVEAIFDTIMNKSDMFNRDKTKRLFITGMLYAFIADDSTPISLSGRLLFDITIWFERMTKSGYQKALYQGAETDSNIVNQQIRKPASRKRTAEHDAEYMREEDSDCVSFQSTTSAQSISASQHHFRIPQRMQLQQRQSREMRVGYGYNEYLGVAKTRLPYSAGSSRFLYTGLREMAHDLALIQANTSYQELFCHPSVKKTDEPFKNIAPIDYGEKFCYHTAVRDRVGDLAVFLEELEWMLYGRNQKKTSHDVSMNTSAWDGFQKNYHLTPCPWRSFDADSFVASQLNSTLPLRSQIVMIDGIKDYQARDYTTLENSFWKFESNVVKSREHRFESPKEPTEVMLGDAQLRQLCLKHAPTFAPLLRRTDDSAKRLDDMPLMAFIQVVIPNHAARETNIDGNMLEAPTSQD